VQVSLLHAANGPRIAFAVAAFVACVWVNQGPTIPRCDELARKADVDPVVRAWLPLAFAYQRSTDEELYYASASAIRGAPYDERAVSTMRGDIPSAFKHFPTPDGHWHWPYSEVPLEYPALVLPFIGLPAAVSSSLGVFAVCFGVLMAALILLSVDLGVRADPWSTAGDRARQWWLAAGLFLAQGGLLVQRIDAVPTLFLAVALWAAVRRRPFLFGLGVGLAAAAKLVPVLVLLPLLAADRRNFASRQAAPTAAVGLSLGLGVGLLPMVALSPSAFMTFLEYHRARGLHVESSYGALESLVQLVSGRARSSTLSFGSFNLTGATADALASASTPILIVSLLALTAALARMGTPETEAVRRNRIACAGLTAMSLLWLFGKVFSPQYMTWAIPFAVIVSDRRVPVLLMATMTITQIYLRGFYDQVVAIRPLGVIALELRLAVLLAMTAFALRALSSKANVRAEGLHAGESPR
jgi:hypothetical protein